MKYHKPPWLLKEIKIEVTHKCRLNCIHCSSDAMQSCDREMAREDCLRIISEAVEMEVKDVIFTGGEPLLWTGLEDVAGIAVQNGLNVAIYTSGNIDDVASMLISLKKTGIQKLVFGIFGANIEKHDMITRVPGSFLNTLDAVSIAQKLELQSEFHFVPLADNYSELQNLAELAGAKGVSKISVLRFVPHGRGQLLKSQALSLLQNNELRQTILELRKFGVDIRTGSPYNILMLNDQPKCCAAIDRLTIGPDLRIYPCDAFKQIKAEELVSSLELSSLEKNSLKECWEKSPYLNAIRNYLTTDFEEPCVSCLKLEECLSGCLAQKIIVSGDLRKQSDPMCMLKRK